MPNLYALSLFAFVYCISLGLAEDADTQDTTLAPVATTTEAASSKGDCSAQHSCSTCSKGKCYWCEPTKSCITWPSSRLVPAGCPKNQWFFKQCVVPGYVLIFVVPGIAILILLSCGCFIYCKCCRVSNKSWKKEEERITQRKKDRATKQEERKSERKDRADAMRMKYGLLKSDDEEPLID